MTPAASMPGVNGNPTFNWYPPRVCNRSANDTPAAATSITTPPSGGGSSTSVHRTSSGPVKATILCANICLSPSHPSARATKLYRRTRPPGRVGHHGVRSNTAAMP